MAKSFEEYPRQVQAAVVAALALLIAAAGVWYWLLPFQQSVSAEAARVTALHAQNAANRVFEQQRTVFHQRLAEQTAKLQTLRGMVPDAPDSDTVVGLVHEAETASGVHVRSLAALNPVMAEDYLQLPFKLRADGTYFALVTFFVHLGDASRITNVSDLALNVPSPVGHGAYKVGAAETVAADFTLSAYCSRPPDAAPTATKKK